MLLLTSAAEDFARTSVSEGNFNWFTMATALQKPEGGIRGISTTTSFRRLVAKTMAKQFMTDVEQACAPFQFALSTRAGTDCVGHAVRVATDHDPEMTVFSIDGIGAYDHVSRSSILSKLHEVPSLRSMLPFVRKTYARVSTYWRSDEDGVSHRIGQHEGGEQGDPLMLLLFSLVVHNALAEVKDRCSMANFCSHSWTTCTCWRSQTAFGPSTTCSASICPRWHGSKFTQQETHGTKRECARRGWQNWGRQCGVRKASRFLDLLSVVQNSFRG